MSGLRHASGLLIAPSILFAFAMLLFGMRMYTRYVRTRLALDDLLLSAGIMSGIGLYTVCTISALNGMGHNIEDLHPDQVTLIACLQLFIAEFYVWTSTFVKLALAMMLYYIQADNKIWRRGLYGMMAFIFGLAVASCLWDYLQCRPIRALWDDSYPRAYCSLKAFRKWIYAASTLFLLTDVVFAILPIVFISKIQRPLREKVVLYFLMALGITCAASIIPKLIALRHFDSRENFTQTSAATMVWSQVEVFTGIIAVCIPVLKSSAESVLRTLGLLSSGSFGSDGGAYASSTRTRAEHLKYSVRSHITQGDADVWQPLPDDWSWIGLTEPQAAAGKEV